MDQRGREYARLDAALRRDQSAWSERDWIPLLGWCDGLEDGTKAIFPQVVMQRCIVHLIRNFIRYIPRNERQAGTRRFKQLCQDLAGYPSAVAVWKNHFTHVEQLFSYGSAVRKIMYTTNAIESVNSSFRKVTKKGSFPNEDAMFKLLYFRVQEIYTKWGGRNLVLMDGP